MNNVKAQDGIQLIICISVTDALTVWWKKFNFIVPMVICHNIDVFITFFN